MKNIKIKNLEELMLLKEMCGELVNKQINNDFYDYYMNNGFDWLVENKEIIINDFENNLKEMRFAILVNSNYLYEYYGITVLNQILKEGKEELKRYINFDYVTIDEAYNKLIKISDYMKSQYFKRIRK